MGNELCSSCKSQGVQKFLQDTVNAFHFTLHEQTPTCNLEAAIMLAMRVSPAGRTATR